MSSKFSSNCSVSGCTVRREKDGYCTPHYLQYKQDASSPISAGTAASKVFNPYSEFKEFSIQEIKNYTKMFKTFDEDGNGEIDFRELTLMMEKLKQAQTHVGLKAILKEVDEDKSNGINLREFLLIFRKVRAGTLQLEALKALAKSIDVAIEGVGGAKNFFEAHAAAQNGDKQREEEIKADQVVKRKEREEKAVKRAAFKEKAAFFQPQ